VTTHTGAPASEPDEIDLRQATLPPVARLATLSLILVVVGGIYMAAQINRSVTLIPPLILAIAASVVLLVDLVLLSRITPFAWSVFFRVFGWALLAYVVIAGILEYVFVYDHTPARQLALFTAMLVIFAVTVPVILAFSVARYQPVPE
jgi:hypothetical protein